MNRRGILQCEIFPMLFANPQRWFLGLLGALVIALLALAPALRAQRLDGTLRVVVTDASGASIVDAQVTVTNEGTNVILTTDTSSEGTYEFPNLLIGSYTVAVEKDGFKKFVGKAVAVTASQVSDVRVKLEIGAASAVVEVSSAGDLIKTTSSELGSSLDGRVVNEIPITVPGGSVLEYANLAPNSTTQPGGASGSGGAIGGLRPRFNSFTIDGADDNNQGVNGPNQPVIQDSVAEFTLLTNQFSAEYGHSAAGQFIITTKSGTNSFHGEAHEYNQNKDFFAEDNLQKLNGEKNRFDYNRAGGSIGGPIKKDKLFFFGAYEFQNNGLATGSPVITAPTAAGLAQINTLAHPDSAIQAILAQTPVAAASSGLAHCNSGASDPVPDFACVTTSSGRVPIDVGTLQAIAPNFSNEDDFITNGDLTQGNHQIHARFLYDRIRSPAINPSQPQAQFNGTTAFDGRKVILGDVWTINSRLISDFRVQYGRVNGPNNLPPAAFANFPNAEVDELGISTGPNPGAPQGYTQNTYQFVENLTYIKGKHTLHGGVEVRKYIDKTVFLPRARAEWDWATLNSFLNDFVPDGVDGALQNVGNGTFVGNDNAFMWFMQDDIKVTPRFTLNLGLRYEYFGVPRDANEQADNAISNDPAMGLIFRAPKPDANNFGPRIGFAYDPFGDAKWSIRGGAGLYYDIYPTNFETNTQPPQVQFENNPNLTCAVAPATPWCASFLNPVDGTGRGFLLGGGLSPFITPTTQALARALTAGVVPDLTSPKILSWSLSVQHQIQKDTSLEVRYLGTHAVSLPAQIRLNEVSAFDSKVPGGGLTPLPTYFSTGQIPTTLPTTSQRLADFQNFINQGLFAPASVDGFFGVLTDEAPAAQSLYHSGSIDMIHRFAQGLYLRANFTFSKTIDDATNELDSSTINPRRPLDARDLSLDRGRSALDFNRKGTISWVYDLPNLPVNNAFAKGVLHGWEVSGSYLAETGQPVTLLNATDANANGSSTADRPAINPAGTSNTPSGFNFVCINGAGGTSVANTTGGCGGAMNVVGYVAANPASKYVQAGLGTNTNIAGRDTINTPGLNIWNIALLKSTKIGERLTVQFRAETYNTFNHRNFSIGLPSNNGGLDSTTNPNPFDAGLVLVTDASDFLKFNELSGGNRTMQLGLKLIF